MGLSLGELARRVGAELRGDAQCRIERVATLQNAVPGDVSFLSNRRYRKYLADTRASAVILGPEDASACRTATLVMANPYVGYARAATLLNPAPAFAGGIHPSACVSERARVDATAWVGPHAVVAAGAQLAARVFVGPGCVLEEGVSLAEDCRLVANVTLCRHVRIGRRVLMHPGVVIGADGFGLANDEGVWVKIPQLGTVVIGDDVEIGANTTVDRGALDDTVIEEGVKLDNQIQVGHNVRIGAHTAVAGCVGIAGSTTIGRRCTIGGGVGIAGHIQIADDVHVGGRAVVYSSVPEPGVYASGMPLQDQSDWRRNYPRFRQLNEMMRRIKALEDRQS